MSEETREQLLKRIADLEHELEDERGRVAAWATQHYAMIGARTCHKKRWKLPFLGLLARVGILKEIGEKEE